jgi:hypothetical protein
LEVLTRLWESVQRKRPKLTPDKLILHHGNATAHDTLIVRKFLAKKSIAKMDHPLYSLNLAPYNFWLFPELKALKRQTFDTIPDIQSIVTLLHGIPENDFKTVSGSGTIVS